MPRTITRERQGEDWEAPEEERPRRLSRNSNGNSGTPIRRGWDAHKQVKSRVSKFSRDDQFAIDKDDEELIHFLEDEPFASWNEHWIQEITDGKKSFVCLGDDCPLCDSGIKVTYRDAWNIVTFDPKGNPSVKYWVASPDPADRIAEKHANPRTTPLNRVDLYFVVTKSKAKGRGFSYGLEAIDAASVSKDFQVDPLTEDELKDLESEMFTDDAVVRASTRRELLDVLEGLED
jgi:hypothetical protein